MPLFKGQGCKAKPAKAIKYITDPKKAAIIVSHALDNTRDYATQFKETCSLFHKGKSFSSRKYYHFKHSFDPKDNITPEEATRITAELAQNAFGDYEYIIATHTDRSHIHCHIIVNSVSFVTGKMLHLNNSEYGSLKDLSNEIAEKYGYSTLDFRKPAEDKISTEEKRITLNGGTSWKEELREVIAEALTKCSSMEEFEKYLNQYFELSQHGNRTASSGKAAAQAVEPDEPTGIGEQPAQRGVGRLYGEMEHTAAGTNGLYPTSDGGDRTAASNSPTPTEPERTVKQSPPKRRR